MGRAAGRVSPARKGRRVAKAVVSVGPYTSTTVRSGQASSTRRTAAPGTASPPVHTSRAPLRQAGSSWANRRNRPIVRNTLLTPCSVMAWRTAAASSSPGGARTAVPPRSRGTHSS
ncbi:hypothetical protein SFUMM280S_00270 [Streptomyces fumanus]